MTKNHIQASDTVSLEFRIKFKDEFGLDYLDAIDQLNERKSETERNWHQLLVKYNLI